MAWDVLSGAAKMAWDVLSGVSKNGMGCFVAGCFVLHSLKTVGSLMKVESIEECSLEAFCNTFDLH